MSDTGKRLVDFDAYRAEQNAEPVTLLLGGESYDLPSEMPAAVALEVVTLKQELGDSTDIPPERIKVMAESLFGKELLHTIMDRHHLGIRELAQLVIMVFGQYNEATVSKPTARPNRATRRTKPKKRASSSA